MARRLEAQVDNDCKTRTAAYKVRRFGSLGIQNHKIEPNANNNTMAFSTPIFLTLAGLLYHAECPSVSALLIDPPIFKSIRLQNPTTAQQQSFLIHCTTREERFTERNALSSDKTKEPSETFLQYVANSEYKQAVNALYNEIAKGITSFNQLNPDIIAVLQESPFLWNMQCNHVGIHVTLKQLRKCFRTIKLWWVHFPIGWKNCQSVATALKQGG
jgi:hypothetical protein